VSIDMIGALGAITGGSGGLASRPGVSGPALLGTGSDLGTYGVGPDGMDGPSDGTTQAVRSTSFAEALAKGLQSVQDAQTKQDTLATQAATGDLTNVHDYTVAAAEAKLATSLTVALRDKAIGAFNEIMRMQV
jgi:flagellar hook-basal body complex protein FliE